MEREGLINDTCAKICELKAELARIQETIAGLYTSLNGLQGDGSGNLQIIGGPGVGVETLDGNRVRLSAAIDTDPVPTEGSTLPVQSGGTYDMIAEEHAGRIAADSAETAARVAADDLLDDGIAAETAARVAADDLLEDGIAGETAARIAADDLLDDRIDNVGTAQNPVARAATAALADAVAASGVTGVLPLAHGGTGGTSLKTIGGQSIVGTGDIPIGGGGNPLTLTCGSRSGVSLGRNAWLLNNSSYARMLYFEYYAETSSDGIISGYLQVQSGPPNSERVWGRSVCQFDSPESDSFMYGSILVPPGASVRFVPEEGDWLSMSAWFTPIYTVGV